MSEIFDGDAADAVDERGPSRRARALIITAVVVVVAFIALTTFASFYTERLWYASVDYSSVFSTLLGTRVVLFLVFALVMAAVVGGNMLLAYRLRPLFAFGSSGESGLDRYRDAVTPIRTWLLVGVSLVLGIFAGTSAAGEWRSFLLWRNGGSFGEDDAFFNKDIGFYVFDLPWLHYLVDFVMAATVVALLAAAVVHYLYGGIRLQVTHDRLTGPAQAQLSVLLGIFVLAKAGDYWLDRYDLVLRSGRRFTGMNFTGENAVLPSKNILMGIALICAVLFFLNVWRRTWLLPSMGLALLVLSAILLGLIWPGIVQQFQVNPSVADKEEPYVGKNIDATLKAYDLGDIERRRYDPSPARPTSGELFAQVRSAPLVDPKLVQRNFDLNQQARAYYSVAPVLDVDRYRFDDGEGTERAVVLAARELDQNGIADADKNWSNLHTVYTHGSGIIAAFANQRDVDGGFSNDTCPDGACWAQGDRAGQNDLVTSATGDFEQDIYFGELSPDYSVVGKADAGDQDFEQTLTVASDGTVEEEIDETTDEDPADNAADSASEERTTYDGEGGVEIGSTFRQLLYAVKFGEANFLLSGRVNANSKVLYDREPRERVEKVAPWLTLDNDAYPAVVDGRILWVLDGYTTTDRFPNSQRESFAEMTDDSLQTETGLRTLPTDEINYMRNAVKATVDAYDGTVTLYEWDSEDPILEAWRSAFPGTVTPREDIPPSLQEHLRYPEDLFKVQRYQLAQYHVDDPRDFFQGNQRWEVPADPDNQNEQQPPFRLFDSPRGQGTDRWGLTSTFVPRGKSNLASYISVDSDALSETYGQITLLELPPEDNTNGPGLASTEIQQDDEVQELLEGFRLSQSQPTFGNLLSLPVSGSVIYLQPIYANNRTSSSGYPVLQFVAVDYNGSVGIGENLTSALSDALAPDDEGEEGEPTGEPSPSPTPPTGGPDPSGSPTPDPGPGTGTVAEQIRAKLAQAQVAFDAADAALAEGDLARYQRQVRLAETFLQQALDLADQQDAASAGAASGAGTTAGASPSAGATPSPTAAAAPAP